ncbi:MAG: hypothetical protein ACFFE4_03520 [Candidatus Thorarchaeota archaeon]
MSKSKESPKKSVHATISNQSFNIVEKFEEEYGSKSAVVDEAIKILKKFKEPQQGSIEEIWCRARAELNMVLVGKTTFLSYIKGKYEEAIKNNIAIEAIEWFLGKRKEELSLEEFLKGLTGMWEVANYFYKIELEKNDKGVFQIRFNHDLTRDYSQYWAKYFEALLKENWDCTVDSFIRNESFFLIIKDLKKN